MTDNRHSDLAKQGFMRLKPKRLTKSEKEAAKRQGAEILARLDRLQRQRDIERKGP